MTDFIFSIAPIFLMIVLGHLLRRGGIPNADFWNLNDKLVYWVLFPCFLFYKTSTMDLSIGFAGAYATVIIGAFFCAGIAGLLLAKIVGLPNTVASSVLQGAARHNTFIALAVAERIFGAEGLSIAALATAILIPITNLSLVPAMLILHGDHKNEGLFKPIMRDLGRNPLLISVGLGIGLNLTGVGEIPILHDTVRIIGAAALPVVLMCVGSNIRLRAMKASTVPLLISMVGKMIVFPVAIVVLSQAMGLSDLEMYVALVFGAVPTASSGYTLARQLGGDAPVMAAIITIQTALSFLTLPLSIHVARLVLQ